MNKNKNMVIANLIAMLVFGMVSAAQADCYGGPKRPYKGWTQWETIRSACGVDLQARYHSHFKFSLAAGREETTIQFRYVNNRPCKQTASSVNVAGKMIVGKPIWWHRESFDHVAFTLPDETVTLGPNETVEGTATRLAGRICEYDVRLRVR